MNNYRKEELWGNGDEFGDKGWVGYGFGYCYANDQGNGGGSGINEYKIAPSFYYYPLYYDVNILFICI